jgi:hypothetical protein
MGGACGMYEGKENCVQVLVGKPEGKRHTEGLGVNGSVIKMDI